MAGNLDQRPTVNSFDMFDTLMARRCGGPIEVLNEVERACSMPGFAAARREIELGLSEKSAPFDIHDIYAILVDSGRYSSAEAERLMTAEIEAEFDNAVPIVENMVKVRAGDLVISDMYLPREILRRLLTHIGLRTPVQLFATNLGKHRGDVWSDILSGWNIGVHLGDNPHSDVAVPRRFGIATEHYPGAGPAPFEAFVTQQGFPHIARIMRVLRLGNPYAASTPEAEIWLLCAQFNTPLLLMFSGIIKEKLSALGISKALFSARDCYFLSEVFARLYPSIRSDYLLVSREVLARNSDATRRYFSSIGIADALVCDIAATGASWLSFAHANRQPIRLMAMVFIDNWRGARVPATTVLDSPLLSIESVVRSSQMPAYSKSVEVLNTAPHGTCLDVRSTGMFHSADLLPENELPSELLTVLMRFQGALMPLLIDYIDPIRAELLSPGKDNLLTIALDAISRSQILMGLGERLLWPPSYPRSAAR